MEYGPDNEFRLREAPSAADYARDAARTADDKAALVGARFDRLLGLLTNKGVLDIHDRIWVMTGQPPP